MPKKILWSFGHAFRGLRSALQGGRNFKILILAAILIIAFAYYLHFTYLEFTVLILTIAVVLFGELINTALEQILNMLEPNHHPLVGKIKDMAAGSVLVLALGAFLVGILLFSLHF
mgnify:CR=1 FL=1